MINELVMKLDALYALYKSSERIGGTLLVVDNSVVVERKWYRRHELPRTTYTPLLKIENVYINELLEKGYNNTLLNNYITEVIEGEVVPVYLRSLEDIEVFQEHLEDIMQDVGNRLFELVFDEYLEKYSHNLVYEEHWNERDWNLENLKTYHVTQEMINGFNSFEDFQDWFLYGDSSMTLEFRETENEFEWDCYFGIIDGDYRLSTFDKCDSECIIYHDKAVELVSEHVKFDWNVDELLEKLGLDCSHWNN